MANKKDGFWSTPFTSSAIKTNEVKLPEMVIGYFLGPFGALLSSGIFTSMLQKYLNEVLRLDNSFLTVLPLVSTIFIVIANLVVGQLIERTRVLAGKARPWILLSALTLSVASVLMFIVPFDNPTAKMVWIAIAYNLYYSVAYPIYNTANSTMIPVSTRDSEKRGALASFTNIAGLAVMGAGSMVFPILAGNLLGNDQNMWFLVMAAVAVFTALTARGFTLNPELQPLYNSLEATFTTEVQSWGGTITYNTITAPGIGGVFSSKEPSQAAMDGAAAGWKDSLDVNLEAKTVTASVTVTNTGSVAGKDAVQLYVSLPYIQGGLEKSAIQLLDYGKTAELAPGESGTYTLTADMQNMTSWDSDSGNAAGTNGCYILDPGEYYFTVGNGAHEAVNNVLAAQGAGVDGDSANVKTWSLDSRDDTTFAHSKNGTAVENQLADMDVNYWLPGTATYLSRSDWQGTWPKTYSGLTATAEMLDIMDNDIYEISSGNGDPASVTFGAANGLTLADLKGVTDLDDPRWSQLMDQITLEECMIRTGFGGTSTKAIPSIMSPETIQNDGPNGIYSYPLGQYASSDSSNGDPCAVAEDDPNREYRFGTMTNATVIGQTFNKDLAREYGEVCGNYSLWANLTIYWGCGTNLHRSPYNARNHEYYSEDAVLTAGLGNAFVQGGLKYGCLIAPKHLAFNDTEINRSGVATFMTEQQARENELRGTQAIIENGALAVMTAYNRVGITQDNAHTGLIMNILRKEWGFKGLISEDFIQDANYTVLKEAVMNGVTMSCNTGDNTAAAVAEKFTYWTVDAVGQDAQLMAALKQAMTWQNYALANSNALDGLSSNSRLVSVRTWYDNLVTGLQIGFGVLTLACAAMYVMSTKKKD